MITEKQEQIYNAYSKSEKTFFEFVRKVNEIYHDVEGGDYEDVHPEIIKQESDRWNMLVEKHFISERSIRVLDIGSGTGFVAEHVCPRLKSTDLFVFADLSKELLDHCKTKFEGLFGCNTEFKKIESDILDFPDNYFDFVTLNSVLHHIPDTEKIFKEIQRIMKVGGMLIIGHEVNNAFFKNKVLWTNYKVMRVFSNKKAFFESIQKHFGFNSFSHLVQFTNKKGYDDLLCERVNKILVEQGIVHEGLSPTKMGLLVDVYSSTGFNLDDIRKKYIPNFKVVHKETYNYLNSRRTQRLLRAYDIFLSKLFPDSGKSFTVVFQKFTSQ